MKKRETMGVSYTMIQRTRLQRFIRRSDAYDKLLEDLMELTHKWDTMQGDSGVYIIPIKQLNELLMEQPGIADEKDDD